MKWFKKHTLAKLISLACGLCLSVAATAAAFQSLEQSAATLGTADAGTAVTTDPSIQYFNPAGTVFVKHPEMGASLILVSSLGTTFHPLLSTRLDGTAAGGDTAGPGTVSPIPAFYFIYPVNNNVALGFGVTVPFGLATEYDNQSQARYFATKSSIQTMNLNPSLAIKINPHIAFGLGFDIQYMKGRLDQVVDTQSLTDGIVPNDTAIVNKFHDWGVGWNAGLYFKVTKTTNIGIAFRSRINHSLKGNSRAYGVQNTLLSKTVAGRWGVQNNNLLIINTTLPSYATLSISQQITPRWTIMGDASWVDWSVLRKLELQFFKPSTGTRTPNQVTVLDYRNTYRLAIGQTFKLTPKFTLRMGFAFDQTPVRQRYSTARLPDTDRYWLSFGGHIKINKHADVDFGYAHIFFNNTRINQTNLTQQLIANYDGDANLLGMQFNWHFV